ncbi:hypothetical protein B0H10DRAFT_2075438 [Mycena sp. CBHHK59/15]|nr:hypothetical protein B0H10DRAFT_2075438 [Mycena sp. CBHHK59/15]
MDGDKSHGCATMIVCGALDCSAAGDWSCYAESVMNAVIKGCALLPASRPHSPGDGGGG